MIESDENSPKWNFSHVFTIGITFFFSIFPLKFLSLSHLYVEINFFKFLYHFLQVVSENNTFFLFLHAEFNSSTIFFKCQESEEICFKG